MNSQNQSNKTSGESHKHGLPKVKKFEQKEPVARNVIGQNGGPGQVARKAVANVATIDQERDRE